MGETGERTGSDLPHDSNANDAGSPAAQDDGRDAVQPVPVGGEVRPKDNSGSTEFVSVEHAQLSETPAGSDREWIVVQLRDSSERLQIVDVVEELSYTLFGDKPPEMQFHFPAARDGEIQRENPLSNYVFLVLNLSDAEILKLERSRLVDVVLCTAGSVGRWRQVIRVRDDEILAMTSREDVSKELTVGVRVCIESGNWMGLYGTVVEVFGDKIKVAVELYSRTRIVTLNREDVKETSE